MSKRHHRTQVTLLRPALENAIRQLLQRPTALAWGQAGINRTAGLTELLCHTLDLSPNFPEPRAEAGVLVSLGTASSSRRHEEQRVQWLQHRGTMNAPMATLVLEHQPQRERLTGTLFAAGAVETPIDSVKLVGPGMHVVTTMNSELPSSPVDSNRDDNERWSRLIGALGEANWQRLRQLHIGVVGAGRMGSLVTTSLARLGVQQLTLIDPDRLELHNLDAMDGVTYDNLWQHKVIALQQTVKEITGAATTLTAIPDSITTLRAFITTKEVDMLICAVDHDGARLATAIIATPYLKPMIDLGAGIFGTDGQRQLGADIRLILPGERCLLCFGGLADTASARSVLTGETQTAPHDWRAERAGSLRSLNQIAAHMGIRVLEDFLSERVQHSTWLHLDFDAQGIPTVRTITPPSNLTCPLCRRLGTGDAGVDTVSELAEEMGA